MPPLLDSLHASSFWEVVVPVTIGSIDICVNSDCPSPGWRSTRSSGLTARRFGFDTCFGESHTARAVVFLARLTRIPVQVAGPCCETSLSCRSRVFKILNQEAVDRK